MRNQHKQLRKVSLHTLVKIRFEDGYELVVSIFEKQKPNQSSAFPVNREAPLGNALLNHFVGEKIDYQVEGAIHQVTILEIYDPLEIGRD